VGREGGRDEEGGAGWESKSSLETTVPAGWVAVIRALVAAVEILPVREDLLVPLFHRERRGFFVGIEEI